MASLITPTHTVAQFQSLANGASSSGAKIKRITLSRHSSRNALPIDLKRSLSTTRISKVTATADLGVAKTDEAALSGEGFMQDVAFFIMETLEIVFFGPYEEVKNRGPR